MTRSAVIALLFAALPMSAQVDNPQYDKKLADSLGADAYGMKQYVLAILKTGPNTMTDKEKVSQLFRGHMDNIGRLVDQNKLVVAGPLGKNDKSYRGIFILNVKTVEEAAALVATDPAIRKITRSRFLSVVWFGRTA